MLRLNRETDYAIRVILALARAPQGEIIPSAVIQRGMGLPASLSPQIISRLASLHLINTYPGRHGGIQLAHPPQEISLLDVILALEGPLRLSDCLESSRHCELEESCPVRPIWIELQEKIQGYLDEVNFEILAARESQDWAEVVQY